MTKMQKYNTLLGRAWLFGVAGVVLGVVAVLYAAFVGSASMAVLAAMPAAVAWTAVAFGAASIVLCLIAVRCKVASVKLMREIVGERKLLGR